MQRCADDLADEDFSEENIRKYGIVKRYINDNLIYVWRDYRGYQKFYCKP